MRESLAQLRAAISASSPEWLIFLGDSFHDGRGPGRLADTDRATLRSLQRGRDWVWITGNHDPNPSPQLGGECRDDSESIQCRVPGRKRPRQAASANAHRFLRHLLAAVG